MGHKNRVGAPSPLLLAGPREMRPKPSLASVALVDVAPTTRLAGMFAGCGGGESGCTFSVEGGGDRVGMGLPDIRPLPAFGGGGARMGTATEGLDVRDRDPSSPPWDPLPPEGVGAPAARAANPSSPSFRAETSGVAPCPLGPVGAGRVGLAALVRGWVNTCLAAHDGSGGTGSGGKLSAGSDEVGEGGREGADGGEGS